MEVGDASGGERGGENALREAGFAGEWDGPDVQQKGDAVCLEEVEELVLDQPLVAYGKERRRLAQRAVIRPSR